MKKEQTARWMCLSAMLIFGTLSPFVKHIPLPSGELALYRAVMAALLVGIFLFITRQKTDWQALKRSLIPLLISGCALGLNWVLLFESYQYTSVSVATICYYFAPVIVMLMCPVLFKERLSWRQWLCFGMSALGLILITGVQPGSPGGQPLLGILLALGAAVLYATVVLSNKKMTALVGLQRTFWQFLCAIVVLLVYTLLRGSFHLEQLDASGWIFLLIVGFLHTGIAYCLYFTSLQDLPGQKAAILSYADPLLAIILSIVLLREPFGWQQIVGGALILGFTLWNELPHKPKHK